MVSRDEIKKILEDAYDKAMNEPTDESIYERCPYPHCDSMVLHAPGKCEHCDHYPDKQEARIVMGVNFTGENDPKKKQCPAERQRPVSTIHQWYGNTPKPKPKKGK